MKPDMRREIELACKNLPEGWELRIRIENGAVWLELTEWGGADWDEDGLGFDPYDDLAYRINQAVDFPLHRGKKA